MEDEKSAIYQMKFPQKLWYLMNMRTDVILWGGTGRTILLNYRTLHNYLQCDHSIFKTTNISSFVRQLNLYGFRKVTSHLQDPLCNSSNPYMHEYVHDYFQYGLPELLNKIVRKSLALKRHFRAKNFCGSSEQLMYTITTPLQKARRALHVALRKAAQDLYLKDIPKQYPNVKLECEEEENAEEYSEDKENIEFDWIVNKDPENPKHPNQTEVLQPGLSPKHPNQTEVLQPGLSPKHPNQTEVLQPAIHPVPNGNVLAEVTENYEEPQDLMNFNDESQPNNDNYPSQFLSMPDLDSEPNVQDSEVELLAEFNIEHGTHQEIITKNIVDKNDHNSLNCVLPSISSYQNDFVSMTQNTPDDTDHYHEWDQMFGDIISTKGPNQECSSDLKELYSQISRTIDLLNS